MNNYLLTNGTIIESHVLKVTQEEETFLFCILFLLSVALQIKETKASRGDLQSNLKESSSLSLFDIEMSDVSSFKSDNVSRPLLLKK